MTHRCASSRLSAHHGVRIGSEAVCVACCAAPSLHHTAQRLDSMRTMLPTAHGFGGGAGQGGAAIPAPRAAPPAAPLRACTSTRAGVGRAGGRGDRAWAGAGRFGSAGAEAAAGAAARVAAFPPARGEACFPAPPPRVVVWVGAVTQCGSSQWMLAGGARHKGVFPRRPDPATCCHSAGELGTT